MHATKPLKVVAAAAVALLTLPTACGGSATAESTASVSVALDDSYTIVSRDVCTAPTANTLKCTLAERTLQGAAFLSAVPVRTVVRAEREGTCSPVSFLPSVTLSADGVADREFFFLRDSAFTLSRGDRAPISQVTVRDGTKPLSRGTFPAGCRITLKVSWNEPDVSSPAEARAILAGLEDDARAKYDAYLAAQRANLGGKALKFLRAAAENFRTELTAPELQELRETSIAAIDAVVQWSSDCPSSVQDLALVSKIIAGISYLGRPNGVDGGAARTLEEFLGPEAAAALERLHVLEATAQSDGGVNDAQLEERAKQAYQEAADKVTRARAQLASWLSQ